MSAAVSSGAGSAGASERVPVELVAQRLDVTESKLRSWLPPTGNGYELHEVEWLKFVGELATDAVPARRIRRALEGLRSRSVEGAEPPRQLRREGSQLVVHDDLGAWSAESGQEWLPLASPPVEFPPRDRADEAVVLDFAEARLRRDDRRDREATRAERESASDDAQAVADLYQAAGDASDAEEAIALLREVVARDAGHVEALLDLGACLHERGDLEEAERQYREALRLAPGNATAWFDLGVALEDRGDHRASLDAYRRSLELDDSDPDVWFNTSRLLERLGDRAGAIAHLARCRKLRQGSDP